MSVRVIDWALRCAPVEDPTSVLVLVGLANHADDDGRNAFPSRATLAGYARCSVDTVDRRLRRMLDAGVIRPGDQRLVAHLPADRRPVVYDLAIELDRALGARDGEVDQPQSLSATPPGTILTGPQTAPPRGRSSAASGAAAVRHRTVPEPSRTERARVAARPSSRGSASSMALCERCARQHDPATPCAAVGRLPMRGRLYSALMALDAHLSTTEDGPRSAQDATTDAEVHR